MAPGKDSYSLAQLHVSSAKEHEAKGSAQQLSLAIREYKEARRLRPRDQAVKDSLKSVLIRYKSICPQPDIPLLRFASHFNLSLRYWDEGKTDLALKEASYSMSLLEKVHLPYGCAEHNWNTMKELSAKYRTRERGLVSSLQRSKSVRNMYRYSVLLFDKRMLHKADAQLRETAEMVKGASSLAVQRQDAASAERLRNDFAGVQDDLAVCRGLRLSLSQDGPLLPCLTHRFDAPQASCAAWLDDLFARPNLDWTV